MSSYRQMPIDAVEPGMVLFDDCRDKRGQVLLAKGSVLSEQLLTSLRRQEIKTLPILNAEELSEEKRESDLAAQMDRLNVLFRKQDFGDSQAYANKVLLKHLLRHRQGEES